MWILAVLMQENEPSPVGYATVHLEQEALAEILRRMQAFRELIKTDDALEYIVYQSDAATFYRCLAGDDVLLEESAETLDAFLGANEARVLRQGSTIHEELEEFEEIGDSGHMMVRRGTVEFAGTCAGVTYRTGRISRTLLEESAAAAMTP
ncbi:MAG: hypothetical protein AB1898_11615 [Acidobacteriota bacterium]